MRASGLGVRVRVKGSAFDGHRDQLVHLVRGRGRVGVGVRAGVRVRVGVRVGVGVGVGVGVRAGVRVGFRVRVGVRVRVRRLF